MEQKEKNKRKLLLFLPLLLLPFAALIFWALGGGKGMAEESAAATSRGINTTLPGAQLKGRQPKDKLALYDQAAKDSASAKANNSGNAFAALGWDTTGFGKSKPFAVNSAQASETKISQKLAEINRQIHLPEPTTHYPENYTPANPSSPELDKLESLLKQKSKANAPDPEMQQLNAMLDKIMQIQHPALANNKPKTDKPASKDSAFKAIPAIIDGNQKVPPGGVVRLKLKDSITLNGINYPKGQSLSGLCAITNQRLLLDIKNIRVGTAIIPVSLTVFSLDGMAGINAPEAELGTAAGEGANGALENMEFMSMDDNLTTQAASAGISAAKGLLGRKARKIRVKLKGGDTVLLRINRN